MLHPISYLAQNFLQNLIDHSRISLPLHSLHSLTNQEADRFLLTAVVILNGLWIVRNDLLDHLTKSTII